MPPLVSILIPAYNAERWIGETLASALGQTWPKKEVIVVDDGSSDNTLQVAKRFESKIVTVVPQQNRGACAARNRALGLAQGDFIQWLDADDLLASDKISRQLERSDSDMGTREIFSSSFAPFFYRCEKAKFFPSPLWQDLPPVEWLFGKFSYNACMVPTAWLVGRGLIEKAGKWDERLSLDDDGEYFSRIVAAADSVKFVPGAKCFYRKANAASLSKNISLTACESLFLSHSLCIGYLLGLENSERTRRAALKLLQDNYIFYYPEKEELLRKIADLAEELGGRLFPPRLDRKYFVVRKLFGWRTAINLAFRLCRTKQNVFRMCDRLWPV